MKQFRTGGGEELELFVTSLNLIGTPETRMVVYTPVDAVTAAYFGMDLPAR